MSPRASEMGGAGEQRRGEGGVLSVLSPGVPACPAEATGPGQDSLWAVSREVRRWKQGAHLYVGRGRERQAET